MLPVVIVGLGFLTGCIITTTGICYLTGLLEPKVEPVMDQELYNLLNASIAFLDRQADLLDEMNRATLKGGWSTHQVLGHTDMANNCRRQASELRYYREANS